MSDSKRSPPTRTHADRDDPERDGDDDQRGGEDPAADAADPHDRSPRRSLACLAPALDRAGRPVAGAADGRDVPRGVGVVAELLAEPFHVDVDGSVGHVALGVAVQRVEEAVPAQDATVGLEQDLEQAELKAAEGDLAAAQRSPGGGPRRAPGRRGRR